MNIQKRLLLLTSSLVLLAMLIIAILAYNGAKNGLVEAIGNSSSSNAQSIVTNINESISDDIAKMKSWAEFESIITASELGEDDGDRSVHYLLSGLKKNYHFQYDIHLYAIEDGTPKRIAVSDDNLLSSSVSDNVRSFISELNASSKTIGFRILSNTSGNGDNILTLEFGRAVIADGEVVGLINWKKPYTISNSDTHEKYDIILNNDDKIIAFPGFFNESANKSAFRALESAEYLDIFKKDDGLKFAIEDVNEKDFLVSIGKSKNDTIGTHWKLIEFYATELSLSAVDEMTNMFIITFLIIGVIAVPIIFFMAKAISGPILAMGGAMSELAEGNNEIEVPALNRKDEIGEMAKALEVFKQNAIENSKLAEEQKLADKRAEEEKKEMMNSMANSFEREIKGVVDSVADSAVHMEGSAKSLLVAADDTKVESEAIAKNIVEASSNIETLAAASEEMSVSISEISKQSVNTNTLAEDAVNAVEQTNKEINVLSENAAKVDEVVSIINGITEQINLLALNATIEAARAGDAGKGFAVVASEVKNLANQTIGATEQITSHIKDMQQSTNDVVEKANVIGEAIGKVREASVSISSAVEEQTATTQEIVKNIQQVSTVTQKVSNDITNVETAASNSGVASREMLDTVQNLSEHSSTLQSEVDKFLLSIRG